MWEALDTFLWRKFGINMAKRAEGMMHARNPVVMWFPRIMYFVYMKPFIILERDP